MIDGIIIRYLPYYSHLSNKIAIVDSVIDLKGGSMVLLACAKVVFEGRGAIRNGKVYVDLNTYSIEGDMKFFGM